MRLGLDPKYESSPPPSRSFIGGRLLPPSLLTYAYTSNPRCARPLGLAARLPSSPHTVICPYFCAKYALNVKYMGPVISQAAGACVSMCRLGVASAVSASCGIGSIGITGGCIIVRHLMRHTAARPWRLRSLCMLVLHHLFGDLALGQVLSCPLTRACTCMAPRAPRARRRWLCWQCSLWLLRAHAHPCTGLHARACRRIRACLRMRTCGHTPTPAGEAPGPRAPPLLTHPRPHLASAAGHSAHVHRFSGC